MSYCRWSSDGWKSDVYVYESVSDNWTIHVAGRKRLGLDTLPPDPYTLDALNETKDNPGEWTRRCKEYHDMLGILEFVPLGLPCDGESFYLDSPGECATKLGELRTMGYHVPDGVIEELEEEQKGIPGDYGES